jgi:hypothetical protein
MKLKIDNAITWLINSKLNRIRTQVKNINLGGCGLFAYHMYIALKDRGIESKILLLGTKQLPIHLILQLDEFTYLDSKGICSNKDLLKEFGGGSKLTEITNDELGVMLTDIKWNKAFDYWFTDSNFNPKSNKEFLVECIKKEFYGL